MVRIGKNLARTTHYAIEFKIAVGKIIISLNFYVKYRMEGAGSKDVGGAAATVATVAVAAGVGGVALAGIAVIVIAGAFTFKRLSKGINTFYYIRSKKRNTYIVT